MEWGRPPAWAAGGSIGKAKKGWWRRLARWVGLALLAFVAGSAVLVILLRFVPVGGSALMVERRVGAWIDGKPYTSHHRWVPLGDIAPCMGAAVIASEDQNFAEHFGF